MPALLLASFLLAGEFGYHQVTWSPPQTVFGAARAESTAPLENWATTFRLGQMAWSPGNAKIDSTADAGPVYGSPAVSKVLAERSDQASR
jgi:hypothetical protein